MINKYQEKENQKYLNNYSQESKQKYNEIKKIKKKKIITNYIIIRRLIVNLLMKHINFKISQPLI